MSLTSREKQLLKEINNERSIVILSCRYDLVLKDIIKYYETFEPLNYSISELLFLKKELENRIDYLKKISFKEQKKYKDLGLI